MLNLHDELSLINCLKFCTRENSTRTFNVKLQNSVCDGNSIYSVRNQMLWGVVHKYCHWFSTVSVTLIIFSFTKTYLTSKDVHERTAQTWVSVFSARKQAHNDLEEFPEPKLCCKLSLDWLFYSLTQTQARYEPYWRYFRLEFTRLTTFKRSLSGMPEALFRCQSNPVTDVKYNYPLKFTTDLSHFVRNASKQDRRKLDNQLNVVSFIVQKGIPITNCTSWLKK